MGQTVLSNRSKEMEGGTGTSTNAMPVSATPGTTTTSVKIVSYDWNNKNNVSAVRKQDDGVFGIRVACILVPTITILIAFAAIYAVCAVSAVSVMPDQSSSMGLLNPRRIMVLAKEEEPAKKEEHPAKSFTNEHDSDDLGLDSEKRRDGVIHVEPLPPGVRQQTREEALGSTEFSLKHGTDPQGWWNFSLDLTPRSILELQNASFVEIRMIVQCSPTTHVVVVAAQQQNHDSHDRVLWQTTVGTSAPFVSARTTLGQILRLTVQRNMQDPTKNSFRIFPNPLTFQTICDDPYKLTFLSIFRHPLNNNNLVRARISLYYEFNYN